MTDAPRYVPIRAEELSPEALRGVIEEFVTREGTDYGLVEASFERKIADVKRQIESGEARIVFDTVEETVHIVPVQESP